VTKGRYVRERGKGAERAGKGRCFDREAGRKSQLAERQKITEKDGGGLKKKARKDVAEEKRRRQEKGPKEWSLWKGAGVKN